MPFVRGITAEERDNLCQLGNYLFQQVASRWPSQAVSGVTVETLRGGEAQMKICVYPLGTGHEAMRVELPTIRVRGISPSGKIRLYRGAAVVSPQEIGRAFEAAVASGADTV